MQRFPLKQLNNIWQRLPVRHRGTVVIAIPAICLMVTLGSWVWSRETLRSLSTSIETAERQRRNSDDLLTAVINAETGVRGYIITQDARFLEPYKQAQAIIPQILKEHDYFLTVHPQYREDFNDINQKVRRRMAAFATLVQFIDRKDPNSEQGPETERLLQIGKDRMDELRRSLAAIRQKEQVLVNELVRQRNRVETLTSTALWLSAIVSTVGFWAAIYLFSRLDRELDDREERLQESHSLLNAIVTHVVDGVITLDKSGNIELFNATAAQMFGFQPHEVIGEDLSLLFAEATDAEKRDAIDHTIQEGLTWQTIGRRKDGSIFPIAVSISDVQVDHRLVAIIRDMTEIQETQAKLEARALELSRVTAVLAHTNNTLEARNQELEQFAYVASHDLKAPLRAIANLSEWLEEDLRGQLPEENQHQMQLLRGRVHRLEALINGLLEYSRVGRIQVDTESVDMGTLLADVLDLLDPPVGFTIQIGPMPTLETKPLLLRQIFANLISNAIKHHHHPTGTITIAAEDLGTHYEFAIADDGPGIHPNYHHKIFVIFQTLEARDTKESTGIGLSIVKKIIENEGGKIWVESQEGCGSTFRFTWSK